MRIKTSIWIGLICVVCVQVAGLPESSGSRAPAEGYEAFPAGRDGKQPALPVLQAGWMDGKDWSSSLFFEEILRTAAPDSVGC